MGEKKTKLMLYSTLVEMEVEVEVELGNKYQRVKKNILYTILFAMLSYFLWPLPALCRGHHRVRNLDLLLALPAFWI